jgi:predicted ATPase/class 3 adenylate cyclase
MSELPQGTVTFLFTDIEGSTAPWERDRTTMAAAVDQHVALLRKVFEAHAGVLYKTVGDAIQAAFPTAPAAVAAALTGQRALLAEAWGAIGPLRIRIALHAGEATPDATGDYRAPALNRLARLLAAGWGGQILLSQAVQQLARSALPQGAELRDLGEHRLRDLLEPERVYQLVHPDLPAEFPPLRSLTAQPHNLPVQLTPLVGRDHDVARITALVMREGARLVTLTGPGGTGKTRLALAAAAEMLDHFPDGVWLVDLAPLADPSLVLSAIAATLNVRETGPLSVREALLAFLSDKHVLVVLDNYEHLLAAAPIVTDMLQAGSGVTVLVTSRESLRLRGEHEVAVPPLALPDDPHQSALETLGQVASVALFVQRAQAAGAEFVLTEVNAASVAAICRRLDGLPLAIELAAARSKLLSPQALLARLEHRLPLLTGGPRDAPDRQRTLRDTIGWSYDLLAEGDQILFRRLGVFVGGVTVEAAEAVSTPTKDLDVFGGLASLVDKSLLQSRDGGDGEPRFSMLETVREFALEQLAASGEEMDTRQQQATFCLKLVEPEALERHHAEYGQWGGPEHGHWLERVAMELDNLRGVLTWATDSGEAETALRLSAALEDFWYLRGHFREGRHWLERSLAIDAVVPSALRARALLGAGNLAHYQGDDAGAAALVGQGLALYEDLGDARGVGVGLFTLGILAEDHGDYSAATRLFRDARARFEAAGDLSYALGAMYHLGVVAYGEGELARATAQLEEVEREARRMGDPVHLAASLNYQGLVACEQGDPMQAAMSFAEALRLDWAGADQEGITQGLAGIAVVAALSGTKEAAARLLGAAEGQRERVGFGPFALPERAAYERAQNTARAQLDPGTYEAASATGRALPLHAAVEEALRVAVQLQEDAADRQPDHHDTDPSQEIISPG